MRKQTKKSSKELSEKYNITHYSVMRLISSYKKFFEKIDKLNIVTEKPEKDSIGGRPLRYAELTEGQELLLVMLFKNNDNIVNEKVKLIKKLI